MTEPAYLEDMLRAVAEDVRATLAGELGPQPLGELVDEVFALADTLTRALDEKAPEASRRLPVCKPGCDSCCHLHAVFVSPAEALRLAEHLRATRTPDELSTLITRLREVAAVVAEMTVQDRATARVPCPLLDEHGACGVHPARPLLCRAYNSCDLGACLSAFEARTSKVTLPCNANQAVVGKTLFAGLLLGGAAGRDHGPFELVHAVLAALTTDDATRRWLEGDAVFSAAAARISRDAAPVWAAFVAERGG